MSEARLEQLVSEGKATILYIHGTARSGSTITEVIFAQLADGVIHQPFVGLHDKLGGLLRQNKLLFDADIYEAGCGLIADKIEEMLQQKSHVTILVKEVSCFFNQQIWCQWIQIPKKFLFIIREPHLQYLSWLSYMADLMFKGNGLLMGNPALVMEKAQVTEVVKLQSLKPAWSGTTISYNFQQWQRLIHDWNVLRSTMTGSSKKLAVLDLIELRKNPEYAIAKTIEQLGFEVDNVKEFGRDLLAQSQEKIFDPRDSNRIQVRKARNSNEIQPLVLGEAIEPHAFPLQSREHIWKLIPIYLDLLYAPENMAMPSWQQLEQTVAGSESLKLGDIHPFVAYAIAIFHKQKKLTPEINSLLDSIVNGKTKTALGEEKLNSELFGDSFAVVDAYWQQAN
ncbi:MAG: hypothetical protein F6K18_28660 [Okeania sp. SIO2C2]|uniref:hypothetical protein n=1 Tax=Okeania sp. SIO2C2 TaxID=2607787 RepID=UPI0013BD8942|nr:hypothetical protein [Okeania sp. SIO2C2]NEP90474.1 hypothetical protein [Okeania sp. SIO2C2]